MGIALDASLGVMQPNGEWKAGIQYGCFILSPLIQAYRCVRFLKSVIMA